MANRQGNTSSESGSASLSTLEAQSTSAALTEAFDQLIASRTFSRSGQLKRLLAYLRDASEAVDPSARSEMVIGTNVFARKDFNPKLDTIVRVEMRRLRQKLDEFYADEGAALPLRLRLEKNAYKPYVEANTHSVVKSPVVEPASANSAGRFWTGAACGAVSVVLLMLASGLIWWILGASANAASRELANNPIWSGFRSTNVIVALGSPLFFRSGDGFERDFRVNLPEDLRVADQLLVRRPANPQWNFWAPFDDVAASLKLDRFLRGLNSTVTLISARQLSIGGLAGQRTIVVGQPRCAPLLIDLLADQNFRPASHVTGANFAGFVNADPKPGEPRKLSFGAGNAPQAFGMMESDESNPDYALITSIRLRKGGEVLSVFGDRSQTEAYLIRKLTDPVFVSELDNRVFDRGQPPHQSAQIVFRVDYSRGTPIGLVYLTHRVRFAAKK